MLRAALSKRQLRGVKFRFIHPFAGLILDFYAPSIQLCIEVDGAVHDARREEDEDRSRVLEALGVQVMRVQNEDVFRDLPRVVAEIEAVVLQRLVPRARMT